MAMTYFLLFKSTEKLNSNIYLPVSDCQAICRSISLWKIYTSTKNMILFITQNKRQFFSVPVIFLKFCFHFFISVMHFCTSVMRFWVLRLWQSWYCVTKVCKFPFLFLMHNVLFHYLTDFWKFAIWISSSYTWSLFAASFLLCQWHFFGNTTGTASVILCFTSKWIKASYPT